MKNPQEVLKMKQAELSRLKAEVAWLRIARPLLADSTDPLLAAEPKKDGE